MEVSIKNKGIERKEGTQTAIEEDDFIGPIHKDLLWAVLASLAVHLLTLTLILSLDPPTNLQPLNEELYRNIIRNDTEPVAWEPPEVALGAAQAEDPEHSGVEDDPEAVEDLPPEEEAAAPPKVEEKPEPKPEPPKIEPKVIPKEAPPEPKSQAIVVAGDAESDLKITATTATAPSPPSGEAAETEGTPSPNGVLGGTGAPNSRGTSLVAHGTQLKKGKGLGGSGVSKGALRAGYLKELIPHVSKEYFYPQMARRMGLEGRVLIALEIDATGKVLSVKIYKPSKHPELNKAALEALHRLRALPAPPPLLLKEGRMRVIVPMVYSLQP